VKTSVRARNASARQPLRILIADTHLLTADSLFSIISQSRGDCELMGYASDALETVSLCTLLKPDLLLIDTGLTGQSGARIVREIKKATPATRILLYCATTNENEILDALRAGADGFLQKSCSRADFIAAVDRVAAGESHLLRAKSQCLGKSAQANDWRRIAQSQ
jgi:DNA-binding NarL/FixJ family response regulator